MTAQVREKLILEGNETSMAYCPAIPKDHPNIINLSKEEIQAGIQADEISAFIYSTACWRHYIGTWELKDGKFYLMAIHGVYKVIGDPIFADWVDATLVIPEGEMMHYVHMGFASVYEFERHIRIEKGVVVDEQIIDNRSKAGNQWDEDA